MSASSRKGLDHVKNTSSVAAAEVAGEVLWPLIEYGCEGGVVAFCQIHYVDVIAYAGAVMGGPVAAKHLELFEAADGDLGHEGEKVVGDAERIFPDLSAGVGAHWVEIPEGCDAPSVWNTGVEIGEHLFNSGFGKAVRVDRLNGCCFRDGDAVGESVDRGTAAEDKGSAGMGVHGCEEGAGAGDVDIPVKERVLDRLANGFHPGEMDYGIEGTIVGSRI